MSIRPWMWTKTRERGYENENKYYTRNVRAIKHLLTRQKFHLTLYNKHFITIPRLVQGGAIFEIIRNYIYITICSLRFSNTTLFFPLENPSMNAGNNFPSAKVSTTNSDNRPKTPSERPSSSQGNLLSTLIQFGLRFRIVPGEIRIRHRVQVMVLIAYLTTRSHRKQSRSFVLKLVAVSCPITSVLAFSRSDI